MSLERNGEILDDRVIKFLSRMDEDKLSPEEVAFVGEYMIPFGEYLDESKKAKEAGDVEAVALANFNAGWVWHAFERDYLDVDKAVSVGKRVMGSLETANLIRQRSADNRKRAVQAELRRRHTEDSVTGKEQHMRNMARVDGGKRWGTFSAIRNYCRGLRLAKTKPKNSA